MTRRLPVTSPGSLRFECICPVLLRITENLASYMCAGNQEMALIRPCKAYSVFGAAHIINDLFSLCASNPCLSARAIPNYLKQSLCAPRECSQADSGSRRGPQWPSQNPVAGSTHAGKGACRCAPNDCNGCSVCASDSASPRNVPRLSALRDYLPRPSPNAHILKILPVICAQEIMKWPTYGPEMHILSFRLHI